MVSFLHQRGRWESGPATVGIQSACSLFPSPPLVEGILQVVERGGRGCQPAAFLLASARSNITLRSIEKRALVLSRFVYFPWDYFAMPLYLTPCRHLVICSYRISPYSTFFSPWGFLEAEVLPAFRVPGWGGGNAGACLAGASRTPPLLPFTHLPPCAQATPMHKHRGGCVGLPHATFLIFCCCASTKGGCFALSHVTKWPFTQGGGSRLCWRLFV